MKKNLFIAFEGIDGCGKSTQVKLLAESLKKEGHKVYTTFEPTDSFIGSLIRKIMQGKMEADHKTIAGLFVADRTNHLLNKTDGIIKKLEEGYTVISDRYCFSSYAYQGVHVDMEWIIQANKISTDILKPDLNIYIDISPEVSMKRVQTNRDIVELYESTENLQKVRNGYFKAFELLKNEENIVVIDGDRAAYLIAEDIWNSLQILH